MAWLLLQLANDPSLLRKHFSPWGAVAAILIGVLGNVCVALAFSDMVAKSAPSIEFNRRISAYYYSQIAKYVPGQVAALLVQRSILAGPRASLATVMSNLELMLISCWLCGSAAIALLVQSLSIWGALLIATFAVFSGAWLIRKNWQPTLARIIQWIPRFRHLHTMPSESGRIPFSRATGLSAGMLILPAACSYVLVSLGMNLDHATASSLTASLMLAWVAGVLAFVFPAGLGIRELVFFGLGKVFSTAPGAELLAEVAIASRLTYVLVDIVGVVIFTAATYIGSLRKR
jgi:hypothetical protein